MVSIQENAPHKEIAVFGLKVSQQFGAGHFMKLLLQFPLPLPETKVSRDVSASRAGQKGGKQGEKKKDCAEGASFGRSRHHLPYF
jgi:hypothetical protein